MCAAWLPQGTGGHNMGTEWIWPFSTTQLQCQHAGKEWCSTEDQPFLENSCCPYNLPLVCSLATEDEMDPGFKLWQVTNFCSWAIALSTLSQAWKYTNLLQALFTNQNRLLPSLYVLVVMAHQANGGTDCSRGVVTEWQSWRTPGLLYLIYPSSWSRVSHYQSHPWQMPVQHFKGFANILYTQSPFHRGPVRAADSKCSGSALATLIPVNGEPGWTWPRSMVISHTVDWGC